MSQCPSDGQSSCISFLVQTYFSLTVFQIMVFEQLYSAWCRWRYATFCINSYLQFAQRKKKRHPCSSTLVEGGNTQGSVQLDWTSNTSRQKNNFPKNQKGYDKSETTVGKLLARRIQISRVYFSVVIFDLLFFKTSANVAPTKIDAADLDSPCQILVCRGFRRFWAALALWEFDFFNWLRKSSWSACAQ